MARPSFVRIGLGPILAPVQSGSRLGLRGNCGGAASERGQGKGKDKSKSDERVRATVAAARRPNSGLWRAAAAIRHTRRVIHSDTDPTMPAPYRMLLACLLLITGVTAAVAQDEYTFPFRPNSGDIAIDIHLAEFNAYAASDIEGFVAELAKRYRARPELVREYLVERHWPPGDVFYACAVAAYTWHSCASLLSTYERFNHAGWAPLARRLGVTPGSRIFLALKADISALHRKWGGGDSASEPGEDAANPETHRY